MLKLFCLHTPQWLERQLTSRIAAKLAEYAAASALPAGSPIPCLSHLPTGQPYFEELADISVSISHTHGAILVGVSDRAVGVDIESESELRESVLRRAFTAYERAYVDSAPADGQCRAFTEIWTRKESFAKACGKGLNYAMLSAMCDQYGLKYIIESGNVRMHLKTYFTGGFCASVCSAQPHFPKEITVLPDELFDQLSEQIQ